MSIKLGIDLKTTLSQTLTPQQIQYLKLLQLPVIQLEQHIQREIEQNPMIEEDSLFDNFEKQSPQNEEYDSADYSNVDGLNLTETYNKETQQLNYDELLSLKEDRSKIDDVSDPFEFYKMVWQDDSTYKPLSYSHDGDDDSESYQVKQSESFTEDLLKQLDLLDLSKEEKLLGIQIIGNIDEDGYLRRDVMEILNETNSLIADHNFKEQQKYYQDITKIKEKKLSDNPAMNYALDSYSIEQLELAEKINDGQINYTDLNNNRLKINGNSIKLNLLSPLHNDVVEKVLFEIRHLDPPGVGSRSIQECLTSQLESINNPSHEETIAIQILKEGYDSFTKKHYLALIKQFGITEDFLRSVIEVIKHLNPKPGNSDLYEGINTVIPDFLVKFDEDKEDLIITINDGHMPHLRLSRAYESMKKETEFKKLNKETKFWIRTKQEDAKFLIQAIRQRKNTMMKVMTAIASRQKEFFQIGDNGIKPMIYKDIAEDTGLDISTVCRIVNGKYVQTEYGTYELKYYFSESLPSEDGEDISTKVIKQALKEIIDTEKKNKPYSDDKLSKLLKDKGYMVARRTVAKYREQLKIPVARLRREI